MYDEDELDDVIELWPSALATALLSLAVAPLLGAACGVLAFVTDE